MGRPKLRDEKKKVQMSVSLSKSVVDLAEKTDNASHFLDTSAQSMNAVRLAVTQLREKAISLEVALELIEDAADVWAAEFDESEEYG